MQTKLLIRLLIIALLAGACSRAPAVKEPPKVAETAAPPRAGEKALPGEDAAVRALRRKADAGDREAQFELGQRLEEGRGVRASQDEAGRWYRRAGHGGHEEAQKAVVRIYLRRVVADKDRIEDVRGMEDWLRKSAKDGDVLAQQVLAVKLVRGEGLQQDYREALQLFEKLAEKGSLPAQYNAALMNYHGLGTEPNAASAYKWFRAAGEQGDGISQYTVALMSYYGQGTARSESDARAWAQRAAGSSEGEVRRLAFEFMDRIFEGRPPAPAPARSKDAPPLAPMPVEKSAPPPAAKEKAPVDAKPSGKDVPPAPGK